MPLRKFLLVGLGVAAACGQRAPVETPAHLSAAASEPAPNTAATTTVGEPSSSPPPGVVELPKAEPAGTVLELYAIDDADCPAELTSAAAAASMPDGMRVSRLDSLHLIRYEGERSALTDWFEALQLKDRAVAVREVPLFDNDWAAFCRAVPPTLSAADFASLSGEPGLKGSGQSYLHATLTDAGKRKIEAVPAAVKRFVWLMDGEEGLDVLFLEPLRGAIDGAITIVVSGRPERLANGPPIRWVR